MTEKEKAMGGYLFNASYDCELAKDIARCVELCYEFNACKPYDAEERKKILIHIFGSIGECPEIRSPFFCEYGYNTIVGNDFASNRNLYITDSAQVTIGDHVIIGPNCCITTSEYAIDASQRKKGLEVAKPITIGNNVWIGAGTTILGGVTIGDNAVIGAGSLVKKSIPANVIAAGNPCSVIREITSEDANKYPKIEETEEKSAGAVCFRMVDSFS